MLSKLLSRKYNVSLNNLLTPYIQNYTTRNSEKQIFKLPDLKLDTGRGNFLYGTPRIFNKLQSYVDVLKKKLVAFYWSWFDTNFDIDKPCTWIFACGCTNFRETHPQFCNSLWVNALRLCREVLIIIIIIKRRGIF